MPDWLFFWGGAVALVLSFLALGMLWRRPVLERLSAGRPLPAGLERVLRSTALRFVLGAISVALLVLVFLTALLGEPSSAVNLAPTFVYVVFWLGVVVLQVVLGNVWPALNPWLAVADAARRRARPRDRNPPAARRATVSVRDARADGALYGWWSVVALAGVATLLAHGGVGGAVVETLLVVSIAGVFLILWLRERRTRDETPDDDPV